MPDEAKPLTEFLSFKGPAHIVCNLSSEIHVHRIQQEGPRTPDQQPALQELLPVYPSAGTRRFEPRDKDEARLPTVESCSNSRVGLRKDSLFWAERAMQHCHSQKAVPQIY